MSAHDGVPGPKDPQSVQISSPFTDNLSNKSFRGSGGSSAIVTGGVDVDHLIHATETRLISGAEVWTDSGNYGDYLTFQVVDVDNVLGYGAGAVLEEFGTSWQMSSGGPTKCFPGYVASLLPGLYVRMKVTVATACNFYYNLHLHK